MKLASRTNHVSGSVATERILKREKKVLHHENNTEVLGPFSRDAVHATVGASAGATLSRNYHSVHVTVHVNIPVHATEEGVDAGLKWAFDKAGDVLNTQLEGANNALDKLAKHKGA